MYLMTVAFSIMQSSEQGVSRGTNPLMHCSVGYDRKCDQVCGLPRRDSLFYTQRLLYVNFILSLSFAHLFAVVFDLYFCVLGN